MAHFLQPLLKTDRPTGVVVERTGRRLVHVLEPALDSTARKRGLLGREQLDPERALVIAPTQGVHTFGMRFSLDLIAVARDGVVVKCRTFVPARRVFVAWRAFAIIELAAGVANRAGVRVGDRLALEPAAGSDTTTSGRG